MTAKDEGGLSLDQDTQVSSPPIVCEAFGTGGKAYALSLSRSVVTLM